MNILVVNQPLNNRGDESAHKALIRTLSSKIPNSTITVLFVNSNSNSINQFAVDLPNVRYINVKPLPLYRRFSLSAMKKGQFYLWYMHPTTIKLMMLYRRADWVICAPGGICMGGFQNWGHLYFLKMAQHLNKKIAYFGRSIGPFPTETEDNKLFKKISLEILHYCKFISLRDSKSEEIAKKIGIDYVSTVDTAFLDSPKVEIPQVLKNSIGDNYVVFVPNLLIWHFAYKNRITKETVLYFYSLVFKEIIEKWPNAKVVMLPQTFNYGTYDGDDILFFYDLQKYINDERLIVISDRYSSDLQQTIISGAQSMIGARYHSVVFAINNAVPFVALSYEHKITGLLKTLDAQEKIVDITHGLDDEKNVIETVYKFRDVLSRSVDMKKLQKKAKSIAENRMAFLLNQLTM